MNPTTELWRTVDARRLNSPLSGVQNTRPPTPPSSIMEAPVIETPWA